MNVHSNIPFVSSGVLAPVRVYEEHLSLAILALPGFSHLALGGYIEPLRVANMLVGRQVFHWRVVSLDSKSVLSSSGVQIVTGIDIADFIADGQRLDHVVIVGGEPLEPKKLTQVSSFLRNIVRRNVKITAIGTATWLLAQAGLLKDTRCTIHWSRLAAFSETFKESHTCNALFVLDGQFSTCAGEFAAFDLALDLVARHTNTNICREVGRYANAATRRSGCERQTSPAGLAFAGASRKLAAALQLMEDNIEHPLNLTKLAELCNISKRQLERLFQEQVRTSPSRHYKRVRLEHARRLIEGTNLSLTEVAIACGFQSASHFSKCFRALHDAAPSDCRLP